MSAREDAIISVDIDAPPALSPQIEQERRIAIYDVIESAHFRLIGPDSPKGPYALALRPEERRIQMEVKAQGHLAMLPLPISKLRTLAREYFAICESYHEAVKTLPRERIAELDDVRREAHEAGAARLKSILEDRAQMDDNTAKRLFTLVALLLRGAERML